MNETADPHDDTAFSTPPVGPPLERIIVAFIKACGIEDTEWPNIEVWYDYDNNTIEAEVEGVVYRSTFADPYTFTKATSAYPDTVTVPKDPTP